jgi:hypothetical protein
MNVTSDAPGRCRLQHPIFATLGAISFRRADGDGQPAMAVPLGEREALVPLRALQREFAIADDSEDGRMLGLIAESLDYVESLRPGDTLPGEVLDGSASWQPETRHRAQVAARLRDQLLAWLDGGAVRLDHDAALRQRVQAAFEQAALALALPDAQAVIALVENLAEELSYIEALRESLLGRVGLMTGRVARAVGHFRGDGARLEALTQVHRLGEAAAAQLAGRFQEVDAQTGEVMAALRNIESQQAFIRSNRDLLYRALRGWEPILAGWVALPTLLDDAFWGLVARSYQFLARHYLPVQEWQTPGAVRRVRRSKAPDSAMTW